MDSMKIIPESGHSSVEKMNSIVNQLGLGFSTAIYFLVTTLETMTLASNLMIAELLAPPLAFSCTTENKQIVTFDSNCQNTDERFQNVSYDECRQFEFDSTLYTSTLTSEFQLVCSRGWYREVFQMLFTIGSIFGTLVGGALADIYGRLGLVIVGTVLSCVSVIVMCSSSFLWPILVARFCLGVSSQFAHAPSFLLGLETCPTKYRMWYNMSESFPFSIAFLLIGCSGYYCREWRKLLLINAIPLFLAVFLCNRFVMSESPRWLVFEGRIDEAEKALRKFARLNRASDRLPETLRDTLETIHQESVEDVPLDDRTILSKLKSLVAHPRMLRITCVIIPTYFLEGILFIGIALTAHTFWSPFLYITVLGGLEVPAALSIPIMSRWLGRRALVCSSCSAVGALLAMTAVLLAMGRAGGIEVMLTVIFAYMALVGYSQMGCLFGAELFPTTVRTLGVSICLAMTRVANSVPPFINIFMPVSLPWLPMALNSIVAILAAMLVWLLPETRGRPLMQTVQDHVTYSNIH